jgi:predicted MFS family arabinose efflux permease
MGLSQRSKTALFATILIAALGCLQPGIDPVFLTLLSSAHPVAPANHGWIVGATQAGMALGSLIVWRVGARLSRAVFVLAALVTLIASLATAQVGETAALLAIRAGYGLAMGMIYTRAMSAAAAWRPNGAYGAVFLIQLLLSSVAALGLPPIADIMGARWALAALAIAPLLALLLILALADPEQPSPHQGESRHAEQRRPVDPPAWALATATLLFICATMMVWSFAGALAIAGEIDEDAVGQAVAAGSLAGALAALAVMREKPLVPLPLTGILAGLSLLSPIPAASSGDDGLFILSIVLLNIGSTAIIIRCSGMASTRSGDSLFRRLVACTHPLGMILGPAAGSLLTASLGEAGLLGGAVVAITAACLSLLFAALWQRERGAAALLRDGIETAA